MFTDLTHPVHIGPPRYVTHDVIVEGRRVPLLEAHPLEDGRINVVFDRTHCILLDEEAFGQTVGFVAEVIRRCLDYKFAWPIVMEIGEVETNDDEKL